MVLRGHCDVVLLLGVPGAGKGTQARYVAEALGRPHVASGDLLREHRQRGTKLGRAAQAFMDRGDLVPDDLVVDMVVDRLGAPDATQGVLLDGFPRTLAQAEALDRELAARGGSVRVAVYLDVPRAVLVDRLAGRWICRGCQASYHERFRPPALPTRCDACDGELYQRPDDRREVVENRLRVYLEQTQPVVDHYTRKGVLRRVNGDRPVEAVRADLRKAIVARAPALAPA